MSDETEDKPDSPTVRLATTTAMGRTANSSGKDRYPHHRDATDKGELLAPALLVSFFYLNLFQDNRHQFHFRDWVLDSGAFSAHNSGVEINLDDYIRKCQELQDTDPALTEIFSLDVIGDWQASVKNCEKMWAAGVEAIPTYHYGEPVDVLLGLAKDYPKIALGGAVGLKGNTKVKFAEQCFARVWPKKIHGFGYGSEKALMAVPFHSVDATNWEMGPCAFGRWRSFGGKLSVRGSSQNLRSEVEWYLRLEQRARARWRKEMAILDDQPAPTVRLAEANAARIGRRLQALAKPETSQTNEGD